jgi:ADP-heptose:LPS heptosyltransferase
MIDNIRNIVWVRTDSIGDAVLSASMLPYIRRKYEGARIVVVCQEHIAELYEACPYVDEVVVFNRGRALEDERYRLEITARLRMLKPQLSLNSVYSREALTDWFAINCGAEQRIAFNGDLCNMSSETRDTHNQLYTTLLPSKDEHKPELARHKDFLNAIGIDAPSLKPTVWTTAEDEAFAESFFQENGLSSRNTIALFPSAQHSEKIYEQYKSVLQNLEGYDFLILGGRDAERYAGEIWAGLPGKCWNLAGRTTIRRMAAIIRRCRLYLGSDSVGAHIACAVGVPSVVVLGGGHFGRFIPYSPLTSVVCLPLECYGCNWNCRFERPCCIKDVSPEVVGEALLRTLEKTSSKIRVFVQGASLWKAQAGRPEWKPCGQFLGTDNIEIVAVEGRGNATAPGRDGLDVRTPQREGLPDGRGRSDVETHSHAQLTIATSIAPKAPQAPHQAPRVPGGGAEGPCGEIEKQARAIESWVKLGFRPVSINCIEEIDALRESFPQVEFVPAKRDAREVFGKPLIYFDDFLEYFRRGDFEFGGIVNSDIFLAGDEGVIPFIESQARDSLVYGSRIDVDSRGILEGQVYEQGFDFFFFHKSLIPHIPKSEFCIGAPWWDYWAPLIAALEGFQIKRLVGPFAYHVRHRFRWDHKQWASLAQKCFAYLIDKARENFYEDPDTNPWALLGKIFHTNHNGDTRWSGRDDKMLPWVFSSSILEFLEKKSLRIGYAKDRPPIRRDVSEPAEKKRDIFIRKTDSPILRPAPQAPQQAPMPPGGGALRRGGDEREKQCELSIVLCTKDRAELLDEMLDSLEQAAAGAAYELIVVEGGSCDDTLDVLRKHGVKEVYSESEWLGPQRHSWPQLYNFGFSKARGKWAMYASDDIVFAPGAITRALEVLERQKEDVAGGIFFYRNLRPTRQDWAEYGIDFTDGVRLLMNYGLVRLESFRRVGGFDKAYRFYCADTDLCHKLYEAGQQLIPLPGCFVTHNDLLDAQKQANADVSGRDIELCRQRWSHFMRDDAAVPRRLLWRDDLSEAFDVPGDLEKTDSGIESFWRGLACFQQGMFGRAEHEFVEAVKSFCDHKQVLWRLAQAADKCHDKALAEKAAVGVVRLAPDFEPGLDLLIRVTGRQFSGDSAAPVLCSAQSGSVDTVNSHACEPAFEISCEEGSPCSESWEAADLTNQASLAVTMVRTPRRSDAVRSETELRRKLEKFSKVVVWGLKTGGHTHAHIHRHFFNTLRRLDANVVLVDDLLENNDTIESNDLVISVDVASRHLPIRQGAYYCLHNCADDIHQRIDPSKSIRLRTYTRSAEQAGEKWDQVTFFDGKTRTLFQPWATDLLAGEFEEPILKSPSNIVFWVGSIWNDRLNRGNVNEIRILKDVLEKRDMRFVHLQGISDLLNVRYVRHSLIAPAIAGGWQVENDYLPCRMWKNISYGQLGVSNVRKFDEVFNGCAVAGRSIEEIIDNTLSLPFSRYRDMIYEQQEVVKNHHTYVNRLLNIVRAFESVENC